MKVAVLYTGFLRTNYMATEAFRQFANHPAVDHYAICWDIRSTGAPGGVSVTDENAVTPKHVHDRYGDNIKVQIESLADYEANRPYTFVPMDRENDVLKTSERARQHNEVGYAQRIIDMHYLNKKGLEMIDNVDQYDLIIKFRHDMFLRAPLPITINDVLNIDDHQMVGDVTRLHWYNSTGLHHTDLMPYGLSYQMGWGKPAVMKPFLDIHSSLKDMYENDNVDLSDYEHVMSYYIQKVKNIPYQVHYIQNRYVFIRIKK